MEIVSIYMVTDLKTGKQYEEAIHGDGQNAAAQVAALYPRRTKFVLNGFEIDGDYKPLRIKTRYND